MNLFMLKLSKVHISIINFIQNRYLMIFKRQIFFDLLLTSVDLSSKSLIAILRYLIFAAFTLFLLLNLLYFFLYHSLYYYHSMMKIFEYLNLLFLIFLKFFNNIPFSILKMCLNLLPAHLKALIVNFSMNILIQCF